MGNVKRERENRSNGLKPKSLAGPGECSGGEVRKKEGMRQSSTTTVPSL